jgi:hypothetical protein
VILSLKLKQGILILLSIALAQVVFYNCSDRLETPTIEKDSTIVYPSKTINGIEANITFCEKISKKTGEPVKAGTVFLIKEKAKLFAVINLKNREMHISKNLMFHIDWIDSSGNSFYKKRIDFSPDDSSSSITSSISISPQKRKAGKYYARVYLFRELIAEKKFLLVESINDSATVKKKNKSEIKNKTVKKVTVKKTKKPEVETETVKASIILCRKVSKKTGKPIGIDTTFTIKDSANVKAVVSIEKQDIKTNEQLKFYFDWIGPDGKSFYKKQVVYTTSNPFFSISNSISILPEKRKPGIYTLRVSFRKKIIAEQKFELTAQTNPDSLKSRN